MAWGVLPLPDDPRPRLLEFVLHWMIVGEVYGPLGGFDRTLLPSSGGGGDPGWENDDLPKLGGEGRMRL